MEITLMDNAGEAARNAGKLAAANIQLALEIHNCATVVLATGVSQYEVYAELLEAAIDWRRVTLYQLDEYIGLPPYHPAAFSHYLRTRFLDQAGPFAEVNLIASEENPLQECQRLSQMLAGERVDVCLAGVGENGHLAFNEPDSNLATMQPYIVVDLQQKSRQQQVNQGLFDNLDSVPVQAISMSLQQMLKSDFLVCTATGQRKAQAVEQMVQGDISTLWPASLLQTHPDCHLCLDAEAASKLQGMELRLVA